MRLILIAAAILLCFSGVALADPPLGNPSQQQTSDPVGDENVVETVVTAVLNLLGVGDDDPDADTLGTEPDVVEPCFSKQPKQPWPDYGWDDPSLENSTNVPK